MPTRRSLLKGATAAAGAAGLAAATRPVPAAAQRPRSAADPDYVAHNGRVRQSVMGWCFNPMPAEELARHCKALGIVAMEGIPRSAYPAVKELGLEISLVGSHGFAKGPCDPRYVDEAVAQLEEAVQVAADVGSSRVITFTGMRFDDMDEEKARQRCLDAWKKVLPLYEKAGVTLVVEHLNSRDGSHPMKGHPGYFGDDVDFCLDLVRAIGSPNFKLLFDIYHVSIMNGDIIRRIRDHHELIGHYHTAGNPGRAELDDTQEINYPPILRSILETGYEGFVAQEFIPTWDDPVASLRHGVQVCDV